MIQSLDPFALWIGRIVLVTGGIALTVCLLYFALYYAADRFCKGHKILEIARKVADEKWIRKHGPPIKDNYVCPE